MLTLSLRLKTFISTVGGAVASLWYWEDSVQMEWESGIGILSE